MRGFFSGAVVFFLTLTVAAQSPPGKPIAKPAVEEPPLYYDITGDESAAKFDARLRVALEKRLVWNYEETSLKDVVADLTKQLEIPFELNAEELDEVGVNEATPITFGAEMTARGALKKFLTDHGLTFEPRHDRVVITNPDKAREIPRLYPVADLIEKPRRLRGAGTRDLESLIQLISSTVSPAAWPIGREGIEGVNDNAVAISLPYDAQREVELFLSTLRRAQRLVREQPETFPADGLDVFGTEAMRKKLDAVDAFEIDGTVVDVAITMGRKLGVPVILASRDLDEVGVSSDSKCKGSFEKTPIRRGLREILRPLGLTYFVTPDSVVISNPDAAARPENIAFRIFYRPHGISPESDIRAIQQMTGFSNWSNTGGSGWIEVVPEQPLFVVRATEEVIEQVAAAFAAMRKIDDWERRLPDAAPPEYETRLFEISWTKPREVAAGDKGESRVDTVEPSAEQIAQLMGFLRRNVAPESWAGKEVRMDAWRNRLLIRQKGAVLKEIDEWLRELGAGPRSSFGSGLGR